MIKNKILSFLILGLITYSASIVGGIATFKSKEPWYSSLTKASFNPPDWIFAPVWTTLYFFMTVAIWLVWENNKDRGKIMLIYLIHLFFNATWSIVFFAFHSIFYALAVLIVLIFLIVILLLEFKKVKLLSFYLMIPYLIWCLYALLLNSTLLVLN
jgi:translocator protein